MPEHSPLQSEDILSLLALKPSEILRNHHRSIVEKVSFKNKDYVIKQPNNKNLSTWIRFTTLYRDSEVLRDLKSQLLLNSIGIDTVTPVAALVKLKFGMVYDSKIIYRYRKGSEISEANYPQMIGIMNILHDKGYLHDDPHIKNFLQHDNNVFVIDCKPRKNYFAQLGISHNNITLARRSHESTVIYDLIGENPSNNIKYKLTNVFVELQQICRNIKNGLRNITGLSHKR